MIKWILKKIWKRTLSLILFTISIFLFLSAISFYVKFKSFKDDGVLTEAVVIDKSLYNERTSRRPEPEGKIVVNFEDEYGNEFSVTKGLSYETYKKFQIGQSVHIHYLKNNPEKVFIGKNITNPKKPFIFMSTFAGIVAFLGFIAYLFEGSS